jgi:hypothetical protein
MTTNKNIRIDKDNMLRFQQQRHFARYHRAEYRAKTNNETPSEIYSKQTVPHIRVYSVSALKMRHDARVV